MNAADFEPEHKNEICIDKLELLSFLNMLRRTGAKLSVELINDRLYIVIEAYELYIEDIEEIKILISMGIAEIERVRAEKFKVHLYLRVDEEIA